MFCVECGKVLNDDSKFCSSCGKVIVSSDSNVNLKINTENQVKLVPAKCTGCGATLRVDASESAAICPYCKNAYIVEQAINNYNIKVGGNLHVGSAIINVSGVNVENLLERANNFASNGDFQRALDYFNQVLDIDFRNKKAEDGIKEMKYRIDNYIYFSADANILFSNGVLQLKKNRLVFLSNKGIEKVYYLDQITDLSKQLGGIEFKYPKKMMPVVIGIKKFGQSKQIVDLINSAMMGRYPELNISNNYR